MKQEGAGESEAEKESPSRANEGPPSDNNASPGKQQQQQPTPSSQSTSRRESAVLSEKTTGEGKEAVENLSESVKQGQQTMREHERQQLMMLQEQQQALIQQRLEQQHQMDQNGRVRSQSVHSADLQGGSPVGLAAAQAQPSFQPEANSQQQQQQQAYPPYYRQQPGQAGGGQAYYPQRSYPQQTPGQQMYAQGNYPQPASQQQFAYPPQQQASQGSYLSPQTQSAQGLYAPGVSQPSQQFVAQQPAGGFQPSPSQQHAQPAPYNAQPQTYPPPQSQTPASQKSKSKTTKLKQKKQSSSPREQQQSSSQQQPSPAEQQAPPRLPPISQLSQPPAPMAQYAQQEQQMPARPADQGVQAAQQYAAAYHQPAGVGQEQQGMMQQYATQPMTQHPIYAPAAQQSQAGYYTTYRDSNEQYGAAVAGTQATGYQPFIDPALGGVRQGQQAQQLRYFQQPIQPNSAPPMVPTDSQVQALARTPRTRKRQVNGAEMAVVAPVIVQPVPTGAAIAMAAADAVSPLENALDDKRFECSECGRKFRRREHLKRHISTLHQRDKRECFSFPLFILDEGI
ncbi:hypothetical protein BZA70DRAFT_165268 [Myxozyma melibiosi]|uniref:C2H2-type domain-containing protein n=1 Tax=Myxozyma melibiosi TaxID=54550 RepID=A0ABR1F6Y5_9ASCO